MGDRDSVSGLKDWDDGGERVQLQEDHTQSPWDTLLQGIVKEAMADNGTSDPRTTLWVSSQ